MGWAIYTANLYKFHTNLLVFWTSYRWVGDGDVRWVSSLNVLLRAC